MRSTRPAAALLALGAAGVSVTAITLAATAVTPFWQGCRRASRPASSEASRSLLWKPSPSGLVLALAVAFGLGFATYLGMALATLSWWEA